MDSYIGEIMFFAGNYAPQDFMVCDGTLLPVSQYSALFSLIGTRYGGDGASTFALPDLRARVPVHFGQGPGSQYNYSQGQAFGAAQTTLGISNIPTHNHTLLVDNTSTPTVVADPTGAYLTTTSDDNPNVATAAYAPPSTANVVQMSPSTLSPAGGVGSPAPIDNRMPTMALTAIMCVNGLFPSQP